MSAELDAWRKGGSFFLYRGHRIFYRDRGHGPVILLLHGFPSSTFDFDALWPALVERFRVVACDLIGFGLSEKAPNYPYTVKDQALLLGALARKLGIKSANLFAHDYGASVAQELIARMQEAAADTEGVLRIDSVCYLNGGLFPDLHRPLLVQRLLAGRFGKFVARFTSERTFGKGMRDVFGKSTPPSPSWLADGWWLLCQDNGKVVLPKLIGYMAERQLERARWEKAVLESPVPARLINGTADPVSGGHLADHYAAQVPNADVVRLEGIGHYPHVESPDAVLQAFLAFHEQRGALRDEGPESRNPEPESPSELIRIG